jgi:hypothetical protein
VKTGAVACGTIAPGDGKQKAVRGKHRLEYAWSL